MGQGDSLAVAPDSSELTVLTQHGLLQRWEISETGCKPPVEFPIDVGEVTGFQYGFEGTGLVLALRDGKILLFDRASNEVWHTYEGHSAPVVKAIWRPGKERRCVASASVDGDVRVWDSGDNMCLFQKHIPQVQTLALSPDGQLQAVLGAQRLAYWDILTGDGISCEAPQQASDIAFSPDGSCLCVACMGGCIGFAVNTGERAYYRHGVDIVARRFTYSPDGVYLVSSNYLSLSIWDAITTERVGHILLGSSVKALGWIGGRKLVMQKMGGAMSATPLSNLVMETHTIKPFAPLAS